MAKKICFITTISMTIKSFILPTAEYLYQSGDYDIYFICDNDERFRQELPSYMTYIPIRMKRGISLSDLAAVKKMFYIFKKYNFDIIQYSTPNASFYASIASALFNNKVRNYHLMGYRYESENSWRRLILYLIEWVTCHLSTDIECVSPSTRKTGIKSRLFSEKKSVVVWNGSTGGVDMERFSIKQKEKWRNKIKENYGFSNDNIIYGYVGRITYDKGISELLEAFEKLSKESEKSRLILIGDIEDIKRIDQRLWEFAQRSPKIIFCGVKEQIEQYYAALDVLILPSYREGFGNVVIEAEAMGVPVIVSNIPGPIDAIEEGKTGFSFPKANADELYYKMKLFLNREYGKQLGKNAFVFAKNHFDSKKLMEHIKERKDMLLESK